MAKPIYIPKSGCWDEVRTARKQHQCGCGRQIRAGERYRVATIHPGTDCGTGHWDRYPECQACAMRHGRPIEIPGCTCLPPDARVSYELQAPDPRCPALSMHASGAR